MGRRGAPPDSDGISGGCVWEDGYLHLCNDFESSTEWTGDDTYHQSVSAVLRSKEGKEWKVTGKVLDLIPLRNRRPDPNTGEMLVTRISEGMTEWTLDDGRKGYGLSAYPDQIVDRAPVAIADSRSALGPPTRTALTPTQQHLPPPR